MTGLRKAAILLVRMGKEYSTRVLASLSEGEVEELSAEIARLGKLEDVERSEGEEIGLRFFLGRRSASVSST